jgi:hypothetical protein
VRLVVHYQARTERSEYMIHQYFLRDSLVVPRRAWRGPLPGLPKSVPLAPALAPAPQPARPELKRVHSVLS